MGRESHSNSTSRVSVPQLDELLGLQFSVLDDGFVRAVDYMGGDESIVQAARVSYGSGTKKVHEDRALIRYLMRHRHTTPFEMCELKLHLRVPMDCWRQWIRHRTANVNEYSTRYSEAINAMQCTDPTEWREQTKSNQQGSGAYLDQETGKKLSQQEVDLQSFARSVYEERLSEGVAREQARKDLPLSTYTEAYWKIDLHNLLHFLSLRMDSHAQFEIRAYANVIGQEIVSKWCPVAWESFLDYRMHATYLTRVETEIIKLLATGNPDSAVQQAKDCGWLLADREGLKANRERQECEGKLLSLGHQIPWQPE